MKLVNNKMKRNIETKKTNTNYFHKRAGKSKNHSKHHKKEKKKWLVITKKNFLNIIQANLHSARYCQYLKREKSCCYKKKWNINNVLLKK